MRRYIVFFIFVHILLAYWWSSPKNLGIQGVDDVNPQACREQVNGHTCMVWQTFLNGNWDIFCRFGTGSNWLGDTTWTDTFRVTVDTLSDVNPSVAYDNSGICYWCAWQNNSPGNWDIYIANGDTLNGWSTPYQVTSDMTDDESPAVLALHDTVWIVWQAAGGIYSCFYDGSVWSIPVEVAPVGFNPKINQHYDHPLVVWDDSVFIYYSEYIDGAWQQPQRITFDYWHEKPEIAGPPSYSGGVWIVWQSYRDGNYEVYSTVCDSFHIHQRITYNDSADFETSALGYVAIDKDRQYYEVPSLAFCTNRSGDFDIYNYWSWGGGWDTLVAVDTNAAEDRNPVMTGGGFSLWILWQTDRNIDWDIYGSTVCVNSIGEANDLMLSPTNHLIITPNPFRKKTKIDLCMGHGAKCKELKIYDAKGRVVKIFSLPATVFWDGTDNSGFRLPAGVYFVRLENESEVLTEKVLLIE
ncbi:MAG: T9SS type A sorting domain-containing protein [bacterium]